MSADIPAGTQAVVYDLDGTLVRLAVDWDVVADEVRACFADADIAAHDWSVWDCYARAQEIDLEATVESIIADHELVGAESSVRLPAADDLEALDIPAGVCSLNAEAACRSALQQHGLAAHVDVIIGRDTIGPVKPDPAPLLAAVEALSVAPGDAVFVGNRQTDAETAQRAGVPFVYVSGNGPSD